MDNKIERRYIRGLYIIIVCACWTYMPNQPMHVHMLFAQLFFFAIKPTHSSYILIGRHNLCSMGCYMHGDQKRDTQTQRTCMHIYTDEVIETHRAYIYDSLYT